MPAPKCDVEAINKMQMTLVTGAYEGSYSLFDGFGQPGCWQDASCMFGIQESDNVSYLWILNGYIHFLRFYRKGK